MTKRILFIQEFGDTNGGVQKLMTELAIALTATGHCDVTMMVFRQDDEDYEEMLRQKGVHLINLRVEGRMSVRAAMRYMTAVCRGHYDIVHTNHTLPQMMGAVASLFCPRRTLFVTTEHSIDSVRRKYRLFRPIDRWLYHRYQCVISVSQAVQSALLSWLGTKPSAKYRVIYNGIDTEKLIKATPHRKEDFGFHEGDTVIASIGRLSEEKGFRTFIRAISMLPEPYKGIIVGEGNIKEALQRLSAKLNVADRIVFTGARRDIGEILKMADLYVSASLSEGFGLTIVEAAVCGLPVIATDILAFRELLDQRLLFPSGDESALARLVLSDRPSNQQQTEEFRRRFSLQSMTENYLNIYKNLSRKQE